MIRGELLVILISILYINYTCAQDDPKNIIVIEESLQLKKNDEIQKNKEKNTILDQEKKTITNQKSNDTINLDTDQQEKIIVDDIPKEFNEWYGLLPSNKGGLGWLMWGKTKHDYAMFLMKNTNFTTNLQTSLLLTKNFLLSRAQKPSFGKNLENRNPNFDKDPLIYFKEKIKILSSIGDSDSIKALIDNIPLDLKDENFKKIILDIRKSDMDIPFLCNDVLKNFDPVKSVERRKTLIACNIAFNKFSQAQLANDLLENDLTESNAYVDLVRNILDSASIKSINFDNENLKDQNIRIISLGNYETAIKVFEKSRNTLDKIIFEMKLYNIEKQIESLERLVAAGIYKERELENEYLKFKNTYDEDEKANLNSIVNLEEKNSVLVRAKLFFLIKNSSNDLEKSKYLNLFWKKGKELQIEKALYKMSSNIIVSISPAEELSWFIYSISKALLLTNQIKEVKKWLFFMSNDIKNRAILDINFSKFLILLYVAEGKLENQSYDIPNINFFLNILNDNLEVSRKELFDIIVVLHSLNFEIEEDLWKSLYINNIYKVKNNDNELSENFYFNLELAVDQRNLAEVSLISLNFINQRNKNNPKYYATYRVLKALNDVGLKEYAIKYAIEINSDILN